MEGLALPWEQLAAPLILSIRYLDKLNFKVRILGILSFPTNSIKNNRGPETSQLLVKTNKQQQKTMGNAAWP